MVSCAVSLVDAFCAEANSCMEEHSVKLSVICSACDIAMAMVSKALGVFLANCRDHGVTFGTTCVSAMGFVHVHTRGMAVASRERLVWYPGLCL